MTSALEIITANAACAGEPHDLFFPGENGRYSPEQLAVAKEICGSCTVRVMCLIHALDNEDFGIWGGMTERERERMTAYDTTY